MRTAALATALALASLVGCADASIDQSFGEPAEPTGAIVTDLGASPIVGKVVPQVATLTEDTRLLRTSPTYREGSPYLNAVRPAGQIDRPVFVPGGTQVKVYAVVTGTAYLRYWTADELATQKRLVHQQDGDPTYLDAWLLVAYAEVGAGPTYQPIVLPDGLSQAARDALTDDDGYGHRIAKVGLRVGYLWASQVRVSQAWSCAAGTAKARVTVASLVDGIENGAGPTLNLHANTAFSATAFRSPGPTSSSFGVCGESDASSSLPDGEEVSVLTMDTSGPRYLARSPFGVECADSGWSAVPSSLSLDLQDEVMNLWVEVQRADGTTGWVAGFFLSSPTCE